MLEIDINLIRRRMWKKNELSIFFACDAQVSSYLIHLALNGAGEKDAVSLPAPSSAQTLLQYL